RHLPGEPRRLRHAPVLHRERAAPHERRIDLVFARGRDRQQIAPPQLLYKVHRDAPPCNRSWCGAVEIGSPISRQRGGKTRSSLPSPPPAPGAEEGAEAV